MNNTSEKNKRLVLEGFDTLFNKRDYAAAQKFWSPHYIQHSARTNGALGAPSLILWRKRRLAFESYRVSFGAF